MIYHYIKSSFTILAQHSLNKILVLFTIHEHLTESERHHHDVTNQWIGSRENLAGNHRFSH